MLILLTILVLAAAASAFIYFFIKDNSERQLVSGDIGSLPESTHLRPLFEPSDEELRAEAHAAEQLAVLDEAVLNFENERKQLVEFRNRLRSWQVAPNTPEIGELLELACINGESFAVAAETITREFLNGRINGLSAVEFAQLLESHFWLLSAEEREPAVSFRIRETIRELRETGANASSV
jgi:hypothetical protein